MAPLPQGNRVSPRAPRRRACMETANLLGYAPNSANQTVIMPETDAQQIQMDPAALYREETFTDQKVGVIKRMTPVTPEGGADSSRQVIYRGETQILLGNNPLPIAFEIDASSLGEAAQKFADYAQSAAEDTIQRLEEMRRDMQNQIVVPGQGGGGMPGGGMGGMPGGGMPGGGKIQL